MGSDSYFAACHPSHRQLIISVTPRACLCELLFFMPMVSSADAECNNGEGRYDDISLTRVKSTGIVTVSGAVL